MDLTVNSLNDPDAGVRLTASITLGSLGDTSAVTALQAAVANEQDPNIHSAMLGELKRLKGLEQSDRDPFRITIKASTEQVVAGTQVDLEIKVLNTLKCPRSLYQSQC
jgi:HEAT repeat protein